MPKVNCVWDVHVFHETTEKMYNELVEAGDEKRVLELVAGALKKSPVGVRVQIKRLRLYAGTWG